MTTQSTLTPEAHVPHARKTSSDGRATMDASEAEAPELKARLQQMMENGRTRASEWKDGVQGGIRERPLQSVLIAAAVGAVIGLLIGRRG